MLILSLFTWLNDVHIKVYIYYGRYLCTNMTVEAECYVNLNDLVINSKLVD